LSELADKMEGLASLGLVKIGEATSLEAVIRHSPGPLQHHCPLSTAFGFQTEPATLDRFTESVRIVARHRSSSACFIGGIVNRGRYFPKWPFWRRSHRSHAKLPQMMVKMLVH
jgi:hypothetical protein